MLHLDDKVTDNEKKQAIERLEGAYNEFSKLTLNLQEGNIKNLRNSLINHLNKSKSFNAKTQFINNKLEYDQRFFNHGYTEQQQLISDIRK